MRIGKLISLFAIVALSQACDDGSTEPAPSPVDQGVDAALDAALDAATDPDAQTPDVGLVEDQGVDAAPDPRCGDGTQDPGEACDDGNLEPNDGCDACAWPRHTLSSPIAAGHPWICTSTPMASLRGSSRLSATMMKTGFGSR